MATLLSLIIAFFDNDISVWFFIPLTIILYAPLLALVSRLPSLKLAFTPTG